jgi:predicted NUDIX family NTP pyrophosphohydrolase
MYRVAGTRLQVLLVHPGGPFWARKDDHAWSIPKGEFEDPEGPLDAAMREFAEETGLTPKGTFIPLGSAKQPSGKTVTAWAFEGDWNPADLRSNSFVLEWPPKSGIEREFPEVDRAAWFDVRDARRKIHKGQSTFIEQLEESVFPGNGSSKSLDSEQRQRSLFSQ